jgi:hypothetical protein
MDGVPAGALGRERDALAAGDHAAAVRTPSCGSALDPPGAQGLEAVAASRVDQRLLQISKGTSCDRGHLLDEGRADGAHRAEVGAQISGREMVGVRQAPDIGVDGVVVGRANVDRQAGRRDIDHRCLVGFRTGRTDSAA